MRFILLAFLLSSIACFFSPKGSVRQPVWSSAPIPLELYDWDPSFPHSTPVAIPGKHLIVCRAQSGNLTAWDVATGKRLWISKVPVNQIRGADESSIIVNIADNIAILDPLTGEVLERSGPVYRVLDSRTLVASKGTQRLWSAPLEFIPQATAFPELYRGLLIFRGGMDGLPVCFIRVYSPDNGKLLWELEAEAEGPFNDPANEILDIQLAGDRVIILRLGTVTSHELATGRAVWTAPSTQTPIANAERVFTFDKNSVHVLDAATGRQLATWTSEEWINPHLSTAAGGVLYTGRSKGHNTLGGMKWDRWLLALDERSGRILWRSEVDRETTYSQPIAMDGKVVVLSTNKIYAMSR